MPHDEHRLVNELYLALYGRFGSERAQFSVVGRGEAMTRVLVREGALLCEQAIIDIAEHCAESSRGPSISSERLESLGISPVAALRVGQLWFCGSSVQMLEMWRLSSAIVEHVRSQTCLLVREGEEV